MRVAVSMQMRRTVPRRRLAADCRRQQRAKQKRKPPSRNPYDNAGHFQPPIK
jgi:hypothetical protein